MATAMGSVTSCRALHCIWIEVRYIGCKYGATTGLTDQNMDVYMHVLFDSSSLIGGSNLCGVLVPCRFIVS